MIKRKEQAEAMEESVTSNPLLVSMELSLLSSIAFILFRSYHHQRKRGCSVVKLNTMMSPIALGNLSICLQGVLSLVSVCSYLLNDIRRTHRPDKVIV